MSEPLNESEINEINMIFRQLSITYLVFPLQHRTRNSVMQGNSSEGTEACSGVDRLTVLRVWLDTSRLLF
jgi:hypothetical protein